MSPKWPNFAKSGHTKCMGCTVNNNKRERIPTSPMIDIVFMGKDLTPN